MKKFELRQLVKEEIKNSKKEYTLEDIKKAFMAGASSSKEYNGVSSAWGKYKNQLLNK